jgi:membrane dipeptidase
MKKPQIAPVLLLLAAAGGGAASSRPPEPSAAQNARARELARRLLVVDTHIDVPYRLEEEWADVTAATAKGDFDFERARAGGLDAAWMSIYVPSKLEKEGGARALADRLIDRVEALVGRAPGSAALAATPAAVEAAARAGKLALPMGIENGSAIEEDLANLAHFHGRGVRYVTLTHAEDNAICDSSYTAAETRRWHGLSPFGRRVVAEMNRLGILVDLSHVSDEAFDQALALTAAPPIASHSSCRHFTPGFERNLDDARIRALAAKGGVIQINFGSAFLTEPANRASLAEWTAVLAFQKERGLADESPELEAFQETWKREHPQPRATVDDVADHIDHVVALVGVDHVGLGSDFEGVGDSLPVGLGSVADYPNLIAELLARGYSEGDLAKILGGNLMRVWREAEAVARRLAAAPGGGA